MEALTRKRDSDIRQLDFPALKRAGYRGVVVDKDNCLVCAILSIVCLRQALKLLEWTADDARRGRHVASSSGVPPPLSFHSKKEARADHERLGTLGSLAILRRNVRSQQRPHGVQLVWDLE